MRNILSFTVILLFFGCYKIQDEILSAPKVKNMPTNWGQVEYTDDYMINDFWPISSDSTLFYLLEDFNKGNEDILLLDINNMISETYHGISMSNLYPEVSISNSMTKAKQNLSAFGLSDDFLNSESSENGEDSGNQAQNQDTGGFITFSNSVRLNTLWELDLWGRIKDSKYSSYYKMQSDFYDTIYAKASLRGRFIKLYLQAVSLNEEIKIYEKNLSNLLTLKEISEKRALEGISGYDEIYLASSKYHLYESTIISLKYDYSKLVNQIELFSGSYLNNREQLSYSSYPVNVANLPSEISSNLLERRPDIVSSKNKIISNRLKVKSDKKIFFPRITFNTSAGYSSSELETILREEFSVWSLGLNILTPIFNGGKIRKNIKISEYNLKASELEYLKSAIFAIYEVDEIILKNNSLEKSYLKMSLSQEDIQKALKYTLNSYELGLVDLAHVLNIQENLNSVSIQKNRILLNRYLNRIDLILSLGGTFEY